ncbi:TetR/AcrR family transcriptional regulator [Paenirhodobacter sp.]|uniref:TetR/AcrR family transcriptional regulator n=1 Tax=Paenirhodobacter sp. TaxID=1965326 RepID=UPI003B410CA7
MTRPPQEPATQTPDAGGPAHPPKRDQIMAGARRAFFASGFEATSMGEIARKAGVSKGTLYVYFDSKEALFTALVEEMRGQCAEQLTAVDAADPDVARALTTYATQLILRLSAPDHIRLLRMVIAAADRFPAPAQNFYRAGPCHGAAIVSGYLRNLHAAGRLHLSDPERAAWQFNAMVMVPVMSGVLMGDRSAPDAAEAEAMARGAVETFLAAFPLIDQPGS